MRKDQGVVIDLDDNPVVARAKRYIVTVRGVGGLLQNKMPDISVPKAEKKAQAKMDPIEKELATWREKIHTDDAGNCVIPGENLHECAKEAAKYWGARIPGEGTRTYAGVVCASMVCENLNLGLKADSDAVIPFGKACNGNPSKGKKSGCRVYKIRPLFRPWGGSFVCNVFDQRLTISVLKVIWEYAGTFIGTCDWRPIYGRFDIVSIAEE